MFSKLESVIRPVIDSTVPDLSSRLFKQGWDPYGFVDVCSEIARNTHSLWKPIAQSIQEIEMLLLLDHSYRELTGTV
ncbi:MAG: hypothetical protein FJ267_01230 [Planctomycetes bacterium]|nr:hypothetical protein [Planctomycetota bacterium]